METQRGYMAFLRSKSDGVEYKPGYLTESLSVFSTTKITWSTY